MTAITPHLDGLLTVCRDQGASDLHCCVDAPPLMRLRGELVPLAETRLGPEDTRRLAAEVLSPRHQQVLEERRSVDLAISLRDLGRFRVNAYYQQGAVTLALRRLSDDILDFPALGLPTVVGELAALHNGLVLITGVTGSGKTTTLATLIDRINRSQACNIITIEDPVEYRHANCRSIINQRELYTDVLSFADALRGSLRQDPDVIMVGEMRDLDTTRTAIMAAETGHLVFSTLHARDAISSVNRMVGQFSADEQPQIRQQLAGALRAVVSQQLLPRADGSGRVPAVEAMLVTSGIANLLRLGKDEQIYSAIETGTREGMQTMEQHLLALARSGTITADCATASSRNRAAFELRLHEAGAQDGGRRLFARRNGGRSA